MNTPIQSEISRNVFPGFVMALINLPMSIGFAFLAGVPPVMMIVSSIVCAIIGYFLNASKYAVGGPNSATSILIAVAVTPFAPQMGELYVGYVASLALMVGLWQLLFCVIFAKYHITDYLNNDIIEGLVLGIGILFVFATLYMVLGLPQLSNEQWIVFDVISLFISLLEGEGSYYALILGVVTIVAGLVARKTKFKRYSILISLLAGFVVLFLLERFYSFQIERVGWIKLGLETSLPDLRQVSFPILANLITPAFVIAIIGVLQAITVAKAIRSDHEVFNPLRDVFSQGIQNIFVAFLHGAPSANSINKSVAKKELKSEPRALLYSAAFTVLLVVVLDFMLAYIPLAILGGALFLSGLTMINGEKIRRYLFSNKKTAIIFFTTTFLVVVVDIYTAVTVSVLATFIINIVQLSRIRVDAQLRNGSVLTLKVEGTVLSHAFNRIERKFNQAFTNGVNEVILDFRDADLHVQDILNFDWLTKHTRHGVKITLLYSEKMERKVRRLLQLNPEIVAIRQHKVQSDTAIEKHWVAPQGANDAAKNSASTRVDPSDSNGVFDLTPEIKPT